MAKKKKNQTREEEIYVPAPVTDQPITETVEKNYMPYAMSVIVSRALPAIDGFKPSHRKLLYTMYTMGLMKEGRTKSANVVGSTMKLNPHGDASIYDTLARLTRAQESLLHPFIDSKGSFGKHYSTGMVCAAPRYTECKLDKFCETIFGGIDRNAVDMVDNYDSTMLEPVMLPTSFPNILVSPNLGVAVGVACSFPSFNLGEICDGAIKLIRTPNAETDRLMDIIPGPDFPTGGDLVSDREKYRQIFETGRGSVRVRARYRYDKAENCIEVYEIPYSTSIEAIMSKIVDLGKEGKLKEITDVRDEIDLHGFKMTIDLRRGTDPDQLMAKLYKMTPLEDTFDCNFNLLIDGTPQTLGIKEILGRWIKWRRECVRREFTFELGKKKEKYNLLTGLGIILLDIDKAIRIIRQTQHEKDVVPNLMTGFGLNKEQAEYVAEIKLRNINREYIINRIRELESLKNEIDDLQKVISSEVRLNSAMVNQLTEVKKKFGQPRKTGIIQVSDITEFNENDVTDDYRVKLIFTREGYFKKITTQSYRGNDEQKLKEGDYVVSLVDCMNSHYLLFFTDMGQVYKARADDFDNSKASQLGDYVPAKLKFDTEGEKAVAMLPCTALDNIKVCAVFENGKAVKFPASVYETKSNRRKITGAFSTASPVAGIVFETDGPKDVFIASDKDTGMYVSTALFTEKSTRTSQGTALVTLKKGGRVRFVTDNPDAFGISTKRYRKLKLPSSGITLDAEDKKKIPD